jgi:hypothetical protein
MKIGNMQAASVIFADSIGEKVPMKKFASLLLALSLVTGVATVSFAQDAPKKEEKKKKKKEGGEEKKKPAA